MFGGAGKSFCGVSVIARNESSGIACSAQARAMNSVSISTAEAPDSRAILSRSSLESINTGTVKRFPVRIRNSENDDRFLPGSKVEKFCANKRSPGSS
jgi:hypothetical protein